MSNQCLEEVTTQIDKALKLPKDKAVIVLRYLQDKLGGLQLSDAEEIALDSIIQNELNNATQ